MAGLEPLEVSCSACNQALNLIEHSLHRCDRCSRDGLCRACARSHWCGSRPDCLASQIAGRFRYQLALYRTCVKPPWPADSRAKLRSCPLLQDEGVWGPSASAVAGSPDVVVPRSLLRRRRANDHYRAYIVKKTFRAWQNYCRTSRPKRSRAVVRAKSTKKRVRGFVRNACVAAWLRKKRLRENRDGDVPPKRRGAIAMAEPAKKRVRRFVWLANLRQRGPILEKCLLRTGRYQKWEQKHREVEERAFDLLMILQHAANHNETSLSWTYSDRFARA